MKTNRWLARLVLLLAGMTLFSLQAEENAVVKDDRVNVRGQASLSGEVITQLREGEKVTILEEITLTKPRPSEPARWARILLPANTPVWVSAHYIDPTSKNVKASRLNIRGGPGENYSVLGRLEKGAAVKEIRIVNDWMEIEAPTNAYAYVAAEFLRRIEVATAAAPVPPTPAPAPTVPPASTLPAAQPRTPQPLVQAPAGQNIPTTPPPPGQLAPPVAAPPGTPKTEPAKDEPPPQRVVTREGIVRRTVSIQAPTYFALENPDNGRIVNYLSAKELQSEISNFKLDEFQGRKILVTGEESVDPRWPRVPLFEIETIRLVR